MPPQGNANNVNTEPSAPVYRLIVLLCTVASLIAPLIYCIFVGASRLEFVAIVTVGITAATALTALAGVLRIYPVDPKISGILVTSVLIEIVAVFVAAGLGAFNEDRFIEMKEVLNEIPLPIAILDKDKKITYANQAFAQLWIGPSSGARDAMSVSFNDLLTKIEPFTENYIDFAKRQRQIKRKSDAQEDVSSIARIPLVQYDEGNDVKWVWYPESRLLPNTFPERYKLLSVARFELIKDESVLESLPLTTLWPMRQIKTDQAP